MMEDNKSTKDSRWCTFCKKSRHTKESCWKLHGKPQNWTGGQSKGKGQVYMAATHREHPDNFRSNTIEKIRALLESLQKQQKPQPSTGTTGLVVGISSSCTPISLSSSSNASDVFPNSWILDSGATDHMTNSSHQFTSYTPCPSNRKITTADGSVTTVAGRGDVRLSESLFLKNVLHVPKLCTNLISIHKLTNDSNCYVSFYPSYCVFQERSTKRMIGRAEARGGLYYLDNPSRQDRAHNLSLSSIASLSDVSESRKDKILLYHRRLGHPSFQVLKLMFPSLFKGVMIEHFHCDVCELAKHKRASFPISNTRALTPFSLIHSDIWGPSTVVNISGARWFVSFIDDCTRVSWVFLLKQKSDVSHIFPIFYDMINTQFGVGIKRFRSDNAKDFFNQNLSSFFQKRGIIHESSCVNTPQQNGIAERKNGHLLACTRAFLFQNNVPKHFWGEAVLTATHIINRLPTKVLDFKSPMQILSQFFPNYPISNGLIPRIFGCVAFVHIHSPNRNKLDPRAQRCVFIGYSSTQKGYKCYHPPTRKVYVSADVTFVEQDSYFQNTYSSQEKTSNGDEDRDFFLLELSNPNPVLVGPESLPVTTVSEPTSESENNPVLQKDSPESQTQNPIRPLQVYSRRERSLPMSEHVPSTESAPDPTTVSTSSNMDDLNIPIALRKEKRTCTAHPINLYVSYHSFSPHHRTFLANLHAIPIPKTLSEALENENWKQAMQVEMGALEKNNTWDLVRLPSGKKPVGCRWVFTVKYNSDGTVERYKARLVAKGYTQTYGIDYLETFAPVAKMNTVRILLSLAAYFSWPLHQFDVKNAFLHGDLAEEIYMEIPPGFASRLEKGMVCKLKKALYGLKQSPRAWFGRFTKVMLALGYKQSQGDHTLFVKHSSSGGVCILLVYVDDIIVTGDDFAGIANLKQQLVKEFEIKDLGKLKYFLGIEVARSKHGLFISQQKYTLDLLKDTGMLGCKPAETPIEQNHRLEEFPEDVPVDRESYQRLVGRLIYLSHTRPDIAYAVSVVSQFMHNPKETHLRAVNRVLQYLKGSPGRGVLFRKGDSLTLESYTDADYGGSRVDGRSTSGYCTFLGGNLVTWRSKKQNVVARSSAEAEFRSMALGICELLWLKIILDDLKVKWESPMKLFCDNKAAIAIAHDPVQHDRTKHIEIDRHFIKEKLDSGLICTPFVSTGDQIADVFTKGLSAVAFQRLLCKLGMDNIHLPA
jgi:transposase InsO family protein